MASRFTYAALLCAGLFPVAAIAAPANKECAQRANDTPAKLVECISEPEMWHSLEAFQKIADANPGADGHGNRDTGTQGYKQSVDYVAAIMRKSGYKVTIQSYQWQKKELTGTPGFTSSHGHFLQGRDWLVARGSGSGTVAAAVQPAGTGGGCAASDFAGFVPGHIALVQRGACDFDTVVAHATRAGAAAVVIYNTDRGAPAALRGDGGVFQARLRSQAAIPVIGVAAHGLGENLSRQYTAGAAPVIRIEVRTRDVSGTDYNLIADSPYGDPNHVVVVDAHLDSIYGAGILDNASGSATILEIARKLAHTPTANQLRYIWFGGEELGLLGSRHYTHTLPQAELHRIVFDNDVDVTATPNFAILIADPAHAPDADRFPPNVVPQSQIGNHYFAEYFKRIGVVSLPASFGNQGTDSNEFSLVGVPNTGILTEQDCCKNDKQVRLWGGFPGNYEGNLPGRDGGCVDRPHRWCDNLSNNDQFVLGLVSRATAYATFKLANDATLGR